MRQKLARRFGMEASALDRGRAARRGLDLRRGELHRRAMNSNGFRGFGLSAAGNGGRGARRGLSGALVAFVLFAGAAAEAGTMAAAARDEFPVTSRVRVIVDNDFGGDPDGLFQLAHQLLSPSVEVRGVIASKNYAHGFYDYPGSAAHAAAVARELLTAMGRDSVVLAPGAEEEIAALDRPQVSAGSRLIVQEAMRDDVKTPLYLLCGAGLTNVASAYLAEPRIAPRVRLIWIGGPEYDGAAGAGKGQPEYNLGIDRRAAQVVFNESGIPIWQVPRDAYRQALVSLRELETRIDGRGKIGGFLLGRLRELMVRARGSLGEAYVLGDSPLVLLSALQSSWEMDASSSRYVSRRAPKISDAGAYDENPAGRTIRVFTSIDNRLMFEDLYAKLARADGAGAATK